MEKIKLPNKYDVEEIGENKSQITIEPLHPGYGITIGNALRRVMLSSIDGSAITAIKIKSVDHEFSAIENVKEDVVDIILNLKKIRLRSDSDEEIKLKLNVKGEKVITAGDIEKNAQVEIINKNQVIATLTDPKATFEAEIFVGKGRGYVPVEARESENNEIGVIAIDAIYTPVKIVNFKVENVRVGQMTNWNKLILEIESDGTVSPEQALKDASKIIVDHFNLVADPENLINKKSIDSIEDKDEIKGEKEKEEKEMSEPSEALEQKEIELPESTKDDDQDEKPKKKRGRPKKNPE